MGDKRQGGAADFDWHDLKIEPGHFRDVQLGLKRAEVRKDDRGFKVGDRVRLWEYHSHFGYIGGFLSAKISHILHGGYGLKPGFVILSLSDVTLVKIAGNPDPLDDGQPPDPNDERRMEELT